MRTIKKWTAQDDATLQRMATEGNSLLMIAAELGRTPMAVLLRTRLLSGLESPTSKRRMDDGYYDQTKTITQVAAEYGRLVQGAPQTAVYPRPPTLRHQRLRPNR